MIQTEILVLETNAPVKRKRGWKDMTDEQKLRKTQRDLKTRHSNPSEMARRREYANRRTLVNSEAIKAQKKKYRSENKEKIAAARRKNYIQNRDSRLEYSRKYAARQDPQRKRENHRKWRKSTNSIPHYRVLRNLRVRLRDLMASIKRGKPGKTMDLIGCSSSQLMAHIQSKFKRGMAWENYGAHWHVDHILPVASFDHDDDNQVRQCWHWTNLQPLEAEKNKEKGDSIIHPQMSLLLGIHHE